MGLRSRSASKASQSTHGRARTLLVSSSSSASERATPSLCAAEAPRDKIGRQQGWALVGFGLAPTSLGTVSGSGPASCQAGAFRILPQSPSLLS